MRSMKRTHLRSVRYHISNRNSRISLLFDILSVLYQPYYLASCGASFTNEVLMNIVSLITSMLGIVVRVVISFFT
jgi:hypothetical protein